MGFGKQFAMSSWDSSASTASTASRGSRGSAAPMRGPFRAELLYQDGGHAGDVVTYAIRVQGVDGQMAIHRRYSSFELLHAELAREGSFLPALPPKGWLRRRLPLTRQRFLERRTLALKRYLQGAAKVEFVQNSNAWRSFLGLACE